MIPFNVFRFVPFSYFIRSELLHKVENAILEKKDEINENTIYLVNNDVFVCDCA